MAAECSPDLVRYRKLARDLAVQRETAQRAWSECVQGNASSAAIPRDAPTSPAKGERKTETPRHRSFSVGTVAAAFLVLAGGMGYLLVANGDLGRLGEAGEIVQRLTPGWDVQPKAQSGLANLTQATELLLPIETALIANTAQNQALDDLRHRLQAAEAMSTAYASLLVQERAHSRVLEEQLASTRSSVATQESSDAPSLSGVGEPEKPIVPVMSGPSALPRAASFDRLMARATQLREQGNIAAARAILETCIEGGGGAALFALAETYDPALLSAWRTFGTKPDVAKARELYREAEGAGVIEATERLKSLPE